MHDVGFPPPRRIRLRFLTLLLALAAGDGFAAVHALSGASGDTGAAVDSKQRTPKSNGVYIRRFQNGLAITNPKGNGTQTINLSTLFPGETYKRIVGTQDATTNNGATVTSLTINARDGLILKKQ